MGIGSLVAKGVAKFADDAPDVGEEAFKKEFDGLTQAIEKGETPKSASDGTDIGSTVRYRRNMGGKVLRALTRGRYSTGSEARDDMRRADGTVKSAQGFLGPMKTKDGRTMTEFSIGVEFNGKETQIPTLVPGLSQKELDSLKEEIILPSTKRKAIKHAKKRMDAGKSPFYQDDE